MNEVKIDPDCPEFGPLCDYRIFVDGEKVATIHGNKNLAEKFAKCIEKNLNGDPKK